MNLDPEIYHSNCQKSTDAHLDQKRTKKALPVRFSFESVKKSQVFRPLLLQNFEFQPYFKNLQTLKTFLTSLSMGQSFLKGSFISTMIQSY